MVTMKCIKYHYIPARVYNKEECAICSVKDAFGKSCARNSNIDQCNESVGFKSLIVGMASSASEQEHDRAKTPEERDTEQAFE